MSPTANINTSGEAITHKTYREGISQAFPPGIAKHKDSDSIMTTRSFHVCTVLLPTLTIVYSVVAPPIPPAYERHSRFFFDYDSMAVFSVSNVPCRLLVLVHCNLTQRHDHADRKAIVPSA